MMRIERGLTLALSAVAITVVSSVRAAPPKVPVIPFPVAPKEAVDCTTRDADGDGHASIPCGGDDCDDQDAGRFPGNAEVCDPKDHDEDCDDTSFGLKDKDRDGFFDGHCCNVEPNGTKHCGLDCDDTNAALVLGSQRCAADSSVLVCVEGAWEPRLCPPMPAPPSSSSSSPGAPPPHPPLMRCVPQPNGTGVCMPVVLPPSE